MLSRPLIPNPGDYDIDFERGFIATEPTALPVYYTPWHKLISDLPQLIKSKTFHAKADSLELLTTNHLMTLAHWQRAYVILGFLTQAYVWQDKTRPSAVVPVSLGEPFLQVCQYLGMRPILSYAGLCLWNWVPQSQDSRSNSSQALSRFQDIKSFASFTGTRDEDAFYLVPVMVEAQGGKLIQLMLDTIVADQKGEIRDLVSILEICATTLKEMDDILSVLHQNCDPTFFYREIRPMSAGSAGAEGKGLPNGVTFRRNDGSQEVVKCVGGSAVQSSFFQFLDHMLGVCHKSKMPIEMRAYMPEKHREFLEAVEMLPSLRDLVDQHPEDKTLQYTFQLVMDTFRQWRTKHVAIVSRYIVQPAAAQAIGKPALEQKGTAGSLPIPFLKQYRDETIFKPGN